MPDTRPSFIPSALGAVFCAWAGYYVYSTERTQYGGAESVTLIKPLFFILVGVAVLMAAVSLTDRAGPQGTGLEHWKRLVLVASLPVFGTTVYYAGFLVPSFVFVAGMTLLYGARAWQSALLGVGAAAVVWLGFSEALGVDLPLWPW